MNIQISQYHCVIAAAGIGMRMGGALPKQYLPILDRSIIEWSLRPFLAMPEIAQVVVVLSKEDQWFAKLGIAQHPKVSCVVGGEERYQSVLAGLIELAKNAQGRDWVLVHDAARPNITEEDVRRLITTVGDHPVGGLLGTPVSDSLKRVDQYNLIEADLSREQIWRAFTPQMFRLDLLIACLQEVVAQAISITDESSAVVRKGQQAIMVPGRSDNFKVTTPADYEMMQKLMASFTV
jgi:2-C-methyl-D-erythritol 4-phosphate cytidylyltransferase